LRAEEAIKFKPGEALSGPAADRIELKASWTKGGRARAVPITRDDQRDLLVRVAALAGTGSLIPREKTYIGQLNTYRYETRKVGLVN
ncbi:integrase, partial [Vibrio parahaemolyticus]